MSATVDMRNGTDFLKQKMEYIVQLARSIMAA